MTVVALTPAPGGIIGFVILVVFVGFVSFAFAEETFEIVLLLPFVKLLLVEETIDELIS